MLPIPALGLVAALMVSPASPWQAATATEGHGAHHAERPAHASRRPPTDRLAAHPGPPATPAPWGRDGHEMAARDDGRALPDDMPRFFRDAADQLAYLNPEPDRWRVRSLREMDQAGSYDHYIDLENVPPDALDAADRWVFLRDLYAAGVRRPERDVGFLPFAIVEHYQRLVTEWRLWRDARDDGRDDQVRWIEDRIVNDAGVLGHFVTDASQPHHTTIHFNGWNAGNVPGVRNPNGYTEDRDFHARFESAFVRRHVRPDDVARRVPTSRSSVAGQARAAVLEHIEASHARVETLYRLERDVGFPGGGRADPRAVDFAAERLASGAAMLRTLWWSAWLESARPPGGEAQGAG